MPKRGPGFSFHSEVVQELFIMYNDLHQCLVNARVFCFTIPIMPLDISRRTRSVAAVACICECKECITFLDSPLSRILSLLPDAFFLLTNFLCFCAGGILSLNPGITDTLCLLSCMCSNSHTHSHALTATNKIGMHCDLHGFEFQKVQSDERFQNNRTNSCFLKVLQARNWHLPALAGSTYVWKCSETEQPWVVFTLQSPQFTLWT